MLSSIGLPGSKGVAGSYVGANRTGAATVKGGCYFKDLARAQAESTTTSTAQENVTPVTTTLITMGVMVVAEDVIADNARGRFTQGQDVECDILVEGTTDVLVGDLLKPVNAQAYLVKATVATDKAYAQALEGQTSATPTVIRCLLLSRGTGL